jgi:hypothetical protein
LALGIAKWEVDRMNLQIAALCDAAVDYGGKLSLLGAFDTIIARQLPVSHPQCSVALRLVCDRGGEGPHNLRVDLVNADGKSIMPPIEIKFEITLPPDALFLARNFILNIQQLKFQTNGHFAVAVAIDGRVLVSIPLHVQLVR